MYQLPDGLYGVTSGVLRGLGMQPTLLWVNLGGFWAIGIVLGVTLTFKAQLGVMGLWWGLLSGIVATGEGSACACFCSGTLHECDDHSAMCMTSQCSRHHPSCTIANWWPLCRAAHESDISITACKHRESLLQRSGILDAAPVGDSLMSRPMLCSCNLHGHPGARGLAGGGAQGAGRAGSGRADGC